jgi:hypothetical protein
MNRLLKPADSPTARELGCALLFQVKTRAKTDSVASFADAGSRCFGLRCGLAGGVGQQLAGEGLDLALYGGGVDAGIGVGEDCLVLAADYVLGDPRRPGRYPRQRPIRGQSFHSHTWRSSCA